MKRIKRLSLTLIIFCLFSFSYLAASVSAQEVPDTAPLTAEEDPCMNLPEGEAQDECYLGLEDEDSGPDNHCEDMHTGKPAIEPTEADLQRYEDEFRANLASGGQGRLNESTYAELEGKGFSREEIDCHVEEMAVAASDDAEVATEEQADTAPGIATQETTALGTAAPGTMPPGAVPPVIDDPNMPSGSVPPRAMPPGTPETGQPAGTSEDPCMFVPAGPERDACHQVMQPMQ